MRSRTTRLVACALITQFFSLSTISISRTRDSRKQRRAPQNQDAATGVLATAEIPFALITRHRQFWRQQPSVSILSIMLYCEKGGRRGDTRGHQSYVGMRRMPVFYGWPAFRSARVRVSNFDRKRVVEGKRVSVRCDLGGRRII